ncbi:hypothetical protein RD792_007340 [Penstemon davidsonii]|uniref:MPN domain-containing protein n=1 Tax=Penstemon davidsonii TaxID=160366 RepID=A0ABR0D666_9LAMI|nr:hypothetical protein RD792_007340 [Penstemon davidsonii]
MGGESRYEIHQNAYIKLVLHALNHRTSAVNAVLLGRSAATGTVEIVESVPLFHSQIGLLPPLEIALIMIEEYYADKDLSIVGYFHANGRYDDFELSTVARNIGDHITRYFPQAALLLLDNKKLEALPKGKNPSPVVQLYAKDTSMSWKLVGSDRSNQLSVKEPSANIVLLDYISSEKWKDIVDFDDHLDDISK